MTSRLATTGTIAGIAVVLLLWPSNSSPGPLEMSLRHATNVETDEHSELLDDNRIELLVVEIINRSRETMGIPPTGPIRVAVPDHVSVQEATLDSPSSSGRDVLSGLLQPAERIATSTVGESIGRMEPGEQALIYLAVEPPADQMIVHATAPGVIPLSVDLNGRTLFTLPPDPAPGHGPAEQDQDEDRADEGERAVSVNVYSRRLGEGSDDWATEIDVEPGAEIEHLVRFENTGSSTLRNVMIGFNLPKYVAAVPNSTRLLNSNNPDGRLLDNNNITTGGINVGNYAPGGVGNVWFTVEINSTQAYEYCGTYSLESVGIAHPQEMNPHYNTASIDVQVDCP